MTTEPTAAERAAKLRDELLAIDRDPAIESASEAEAAELAYLAAFEAAAFRRGAEAMRATCADYALDMAGDQGRLANGIAALPVPEDRP